MTLNLAPGNELNLPERVRLKAERARALLLEAADELEAFVSRREWRDEETRDAYDLYVYALRSAATLTEPETGAGNISGPSYPERGGADTV